MEGKFEIGDKFVVKGARDSAVISIERIYHRFCQEPSYELKPVGSCGSRQIIGESTLRELYNKVYKI